MPTPPQAINSKGRTKPWSTLPRFCAFILLFAGLAGHGQNSKPKQPGTPPPAPPQASPKHLPPLQFDTNAPLHHLNQVISWYRRATTGVSSVGLPSDSIYQYNTKTLGAQIVKLAFQSAKAEAALVKTQQKVTDTSRRSAAHKSRDSRRRRQEFRDRSMKSNRRSRR